MNLREIKTIEESAQSLIFPILQVRSYEPESVSISIILLNRKKVTKINEQRIQMLKTTVEL